MPNLGGGGSERVCVRICNQLALENIGVELILLGKFGAFCDALHPQVQVTILNVKHIRNSGWKLARYLNAKPRVPVFVFGFDLGVVVGLLKRFRILKSPAIFREGTNPQKGKKILLRWMYRWFVNACEEVIALNNRMAESLAAVGIDADKINVISNPHPIEDVSGGAAVSKSRPMLLAIGRLIPSKGFLRLIRAFARFREQMPLATLTILGDGPMKDELERAARSLRVEKAVEYLGFVNRPQDWYRTADVYVFTSELEGQPNTLIEAIFYKCRVLAIKEPGAAELLHSVGLEENTIAPEMFEADFASGIQRVLLQPSEVLTSASDRLRQSTDPSIIANKYLQLAEQSRRHWK